MTAEWKEVTDPEEIFRLKREGWEIELFAFNEWGSWDKKSWNENWKFRARPPQPKVVTKKMQCWLIDDDELKWLVKDSYAAVPHTWTRQPKLDLEAEFEE